MTTEKDLGADAAVVVNARSAEHEVTGKRPRKMARSVIFERDVEWMLSDWFCPACGKRDMWQEGRGGGDYYHDSSVRCFSCRHYMCCVDAVEDAPEKKAPWWDEVSAQKVGTGMDVTCHSDPGVHFFRAGAAMCDCGAEFAVDTQRSTFPTFHLSQLRHAYQQLMSGDVKNQHAFARGLIGPAIEAFEKYQIDSATDAQQEHAESTRRSAAPKTD